MKRIGLIAFVALAALAPALATAGAPEGHLPPAAWVQGDSADRLWRLGRGAIANEDWDRAEELFRQIRDRYPKSAYVPDSYYWEAWALVQKGGSSALRRARGLLDTQQDRFADAETVKSGDARTLAARIRGMLAQGGDAASAASIARTADAASTASTSPTPSASASPSPRGGRGRDEATTQARCKSEDEDERVEALNALLQMGSDQALPILRKVLARRDRCSEVLRRKAVFLVSQKRSDEAADILIEAARSDPDRETREQAVFWLGQVSDAKALTLLEELLRTSNDKEMQDKALFALSQQRDPRALQVLRDYAARENAPREVREQAIFWLGQKRSAEGAQFLKGLFARTRDAEIQEKILFSLSQMHGFGNSDWILDEAVNARHPMELRKQALFWAAQGPGVDVARIAALYDRGGEREFREQVIFVLSQKRDAAAVDKLMSIARGERDNELRKNALFWLGHNKDPRVAKFLLELIERTP